MSGAQRTNSEPQITLTSEEKKLYGQLFKQCDPEQLGIVTGEVARTLFERTGLPPNVLGEIWQLADSDNSGFLNQIGFSLALRIIGKVQNGQQMSPRLGDQPGPMPKFDGQQRPGVTASTSGNIVAPAPVSASSGPRVPALNPTDRTRFVGLFEKSAPSGYLEGEKARDIFMKARLPTDTLGQIWNLTDTEGRGSLNQTEFVVAMHLIQCTLNGSMKQFPETLPPALFDAASNKPVSTSRNNSPRVGSSSSHRQSQQPVARQFSGGSGYMQPIGPASADWRISSKERARYDGIFNSLDPQKRGIIGADEVVPFLTTSKLPEDVLAHVWDLADVNNTGEFGHNEFAIAMHLVQQKLAGRELPNVLPQSLLNPGSRQSSVSSPQAANAPSSIFFEPQSQPQTTRGAPSSQAPPAPANAVQQQQNTGSLNDLASLNDLFASPQPAQTSTFSTTSPPPAEAPKASQPEMKQFVPSSTFGQSIMRNETGQQSPQVTGQKVESPPQEQTQPQSQSQSQSQDQTQPQLQPQEAARDLLAHDDNEVTNKLSQATTEFGNLSNQISSLTTQTVGLSQKREKSEAELADVLSKKKDIESKLAALRTNYDDEVKKVKEVETMLEQAKQEQDKLNRDYSLLEASHNALSSQYQQSSQKLQATQEENAALKEKIKATNEQVASLKESLESAEKEMTREQNMVSINQKQLATSESEKAQVEQNLDHAREQSSKPASTSGATSRQVEEAPFEERKEGEQEGGGEQEEAPRAQTPRQNTGNPFFAAGAGAGLGAVGGAAAAAAFNNTNEMTNEERQRAFEDTFGRVEIASPSTAEPARSSTHNTVETPNSTPPTSEFQYNNQDTNPPATFVLPIARPDSATSSVQNNPPQSVRGDLDVSRPESPEETTAPVTGIAPPENFPEIEAPGNNSNNNESLRQTSLATLHAHEKRGNDDEGGDENSNGRNSTESYEIVNAEDHQNIPGGFPVPDGPASETSTKDWAENQKFDQDFPPVHEVEQFDESSSDDEGPEDIVSKKKHFADHSEASGSTTAATAGDDVPSNGKGRREVSTANTADTVSTDGHDFASAPSSPQPTPAQVQLPPSYESTEGPLPENSKTPQPQDTSVFEPPQQAKRNVTDPFASAFSGLSDAQEESGNNVDEFQFSGGGNLEDEFRATMDSAFQKELNNSSVPPQQTPNASATTNDEWEQLFAGFSNNNRTASQNEINDAFKVPQESSSSSSQHRVVPPQQQQQQEEEEEEQRQPTPRTQAVQELTGMGFSHDDVVEALEKHNYDMAESSNYLLDKS